MNAYIFPGVTERYKTQEQIVSAVVAHYEISKSDLFSKSRNGKLPEARRVCCYLLRTGLKWTYMHIAAYMHLEHATVIHHVRKFEDHYRYDRQFNKSISIIL